MSVLRSAVAGVFALAVLPVQAAAEEVVPDTLPKSENVRLSVQISVRAPNTTNEYTYRLPANSVFGCYEHVRAAIDNVMEPGYHSNVGGVCMDDAGKIEAAFRCRIGDSQKKVTCTRTR